MSEEFVNEKGERITAPTGFMDYFEYGIINSVENYDFGATGRAYNPGKVPVKYTTGGIIYKYEGWYTGWTKPSTLNTTQPISMTIKKNEAYPITVLYSSNVLKTEECFTEDGSSLASGTHDSSEEVLLDSTFTGDSIKEIIKASNGDYYSYQGWLKDSEVPGTDTPRSGKPNEKMTKDTTFKYIYKKAIPGRSITLTPDVSVIASGGQVTWTAKVKNTSSDPISLDDTELRLDSVPDYVSGSTVVDGLSKGDSFWTGNSIPLIGPGGEVTIEFKTQPVGAPNVIKEIEISAQSTKIAKDIVKGQVRIKDEDSKPVTPGKDFGLENVPSKFSFEDVTVNNFSQVSSLELGAYAPHTVSDGMFVRLFDDRAGSLGWKLTAKLNSFKQTAHPTRTLSNTVTLDFKTSLEKVTNPNTPTEAIDPSPSGSLPLIQNNVHLLSDNVDVLVMNSPVGVGDGTWQVRIPLNDVKLTLPANNGVAGTRYESDLTWTLTDAP
ncbi:WxL domain-containing protein [Enterococcus avium]|uniref:WxL domain-containing protein n=1 Tax=Enterococcus avium TaxID=33945 RepID=UPI00270AEDE4|nr:WxL domain-containing protein [Enterococcus avium]MDO7798988.1 WxL domain-containing protein [Enterococcus avium]